MQIKNSFLYQFSECKKSLGIFYAIIISITAFFVVLSYFEGGVNYNGIDIATLVFLFIFGCTTMGETFQMHLQNSVSRKTFYIGKILNIITITFIMAAVNTAIFLIVNLISGGLNGATDLAFNINSAFSYAYFMNSPVGITTITPILWSGLITFVVGLFVFALGTLTSAIFSRVNKLVKVLIAAGIPVLIMFVLPLLDLLLVDINIYGTIFDFLGNVLGLFDKAPWKAVVSMSIMFVATTVIGWFAAKRLPVKK